MASHQMPHVHESYFHTVSQIEPKDTAFPVHTRFILTARCLITAPALEAVTYHGETLPGAFHHPSPYRGMPTPEIDSRWEKLWDWGAFNVPEDKIPLLNKSTSTAWHHTDPEFGGGVAGLFWGFHQIHCLVSLSTLIED
jgi:hypothetical protein